MSLLEDLFNFISQKRALAQKAQQSQAIKAFILEPILTPSGLVDDLTQGADAIIIDPNSGIDHHFDFPPDNDLELDHAHDPDFYFPAEFIAPEDIDPLSFIYNPEPAIPSIEGLFNAGIFTVGESGKVSIDYLFDGGGYQGQLAIFNLNGMEDFDLNTESGLADFIHEAASRALSNSDLGHVVIADATEGAKFSGLMPSEWENHNFGEYQGVRTFDMQAGDRFAVMLVPNGTVQQVLDGNQDADIRPLFSLNTVNPNEAFHAGQIADVTGDGNTFVLEDLRTDGATDRDYNDIIFQVRGATGTAVHLDEVINPDLDWRSTDLGHALLDYAQPYVTPVESVDAHLSLPEVPQSHQPLIGIIDTGVSAHNPDIDYTYIALGHDYIDGDNNPLLEAGEGNEHGTHIAGIIGATQNNDIGIDGINDQAPLWVGRATGSGHWADSLTEFVDAAKASDQPNAVVNLSFDLTQINPDGSITTRYEFTPHEIEALEYARQNHILIVAAAGNDGGVMSALGQASQEFDNIMTVGSADGLERADYSSYGYGLDIVAHGGTADNPVLSTVGDDLGAMAGTSVATAKVTGAISQVWAANPELSYRQVIELLKLTATDLKDPGWDAETGAGLLNIAAAVGLAKVTEGKDYLTPAIDIPATWSGEDVVTPTERAADGSSNTTSGTATTLGNGVRVRPYAVQPGDTLRTIALRELNNINRWTEIKQADGSNFTSPSTPLQPGAILSLPVNYQTGSGVSVASSPIMPAPWLPPVATARNINPDDGVADNFYHGRKEFDNRIGRNNSNDYYEFDLEQLLNGDTHYLRFALRNQAGTQDISRNNADVELLDQFGTVVSLDSLWQPGVQPAGVQLKGGKYYLRVKNTSSSTILYKLVVHVDSAKEDLAKARELETFTGRHQFQDFIGATKGDSADYYRFTVENQSFLRFSLGDPTGTALKADANIDLLDANGNVIESGFNPGDNKKYGDSPLAPGAYYMRVTPGNSTANTNYLLTMQMAEDLGIYTGRHEYPNRSLGGDYTEAFHQFQIDAPGDLRLALRNLNADANLELYKDNGTGIVNATLINPTSGVDQTGTTDELKEYLNLPAGNYLVKTKLVDSTVARANYDLVMNLDQTKNTLAQARDLGTLDDIAKFGDYQLTEFVGADKSDPADYYKFKLARAGNVNFALREMSQNANVYIFDSQGREVAKSENISSQDELNTAANLQANATYYIKVVPVGNEFTNYRLVLNPDFHFTEPVNTASDWRATVFKWDSNQGKPPANFWQNQANELAVINLGSNTRSDGKKGINPQNWGNSSPNDDPRLPNDIFAIRGYTTAYFEKGKKYRVSVKGDDGYQLLLNNYGTSNWTFITPENQWMEGEHSQYRQYEFEVPQSGAYDFHFHYYEKQGDANFDLSWEKVPQGGSSDPFTMNEYYQRLYGHTQASSSRGYPGTNKTIHPGGAIDSTTGKYPYNVYAMVGGEIKYVGQDKHGGNYIQIWNSELQRSFIYLHFERFNPEIVNRWNQGRSLYINAGEFLGIEGSTGKSDGRHTHIHVNKTNGSRENPLVTLGNARGKGII